MEDETLGQPSASGLTTSDMESYDFGMSPDQILAFNDYQNQQQSAGMPWKLNQSDYYPGYNHGAAIGSGSGMFGSYSLFGGGGALVPMGMLDAQDAAVRQAAAKKAKEVDDFKKSLKPPVSKLTNINEQLGNEYIDYTQKSWQKALKRAGGNANAAAYMLKNDPEFQKTLRGYEDAARTGTAAAEKIAQLELDERTGKFAYTPSLKSAIQKMRTSMNPNNHEFKNFANNFMALNMEHDFANALDEVTKKMVAETTGYAGADLNDPEFLKIYKGSVKEWSPEQKEAIAKILEENFFQGSDYFTPEKIKANVNNFLKGKVVEKDLHVSQKRDDSASNEFDYTDAQPMTEVAINNTGEESTPYLDSTKPVPTAIYGENAYKTTAAHEAKLIKVPISKQMVDVKGEKINSKQGYIQGNVSQIQNVFFNTKTNTPLTTEEVKALQPGTPDIESRTVAVLNLDPEKGADGVIRKSNAVLIPVGEIRGKFKNPKKKDGQRDFDDLINENEQAAKATNEALQKKPEATKVTAEPSIDKMKGTASVPEKTEAKKEDLRAKYNY